MDAREASQRHHINPVTLDVLVLCRVDQVATVQTHVPLDWAVTEAEGDLQRLSTSVARTAWTPEHAAALNALGSAGGLVRWETRAVRADLPPEAFPLGRGQMQDRSLLPPNVIVLRSHARLTQLPPEDGKTH